MRSTAIPLFRPVVHEWIFFAGLAIITIGLPNSLSMISIGQFIVAGNWLLEGNYREKTVRFLKNKAAVAFTGIYIIHLVSLLWSSDLEAGLPDLRIKLPILTLTFLIAGSKPAGNRKKSFWLLVLFTLSVVVTTFLGLALYNPDAGDTPRQLSPFISHIRFGMMIVFSVYLLIWLTGKFKEQFSGSMSLQKLTGLKVTFWLLAAWLVVFLFLLQTMSSFVMLLATIAFSGLWFFYVQKNKTLFILTSALAVAIVIVTLLLTVRMHRIVTEIIPNQLDTLPGYTIRGNPYRHDLSDSLTENGHYVYILISDEELSHEWQQVSELDYYGDDNRGQILRRTLYRYMASLGLPRDSQGFTKLIPEDVEAVEDGIANYKYIRWPGIVVRLHQTIWEIHQYQSGASIEGHTLNQRIEYWKGAIAAIKTKPLVGWGGGDLNKAMHFGMEEINTRLAKEYWHKPHNHYLQFMVTFGISGFLLILFLVVYTLRKTGSYKIFINGIFLVIIAVSMLSEDTLNTQAGLSFFVLFFCFFNYYFPTPKTGPDSICL